MALNNNQITYLRNMFTERVNFNHRERELYGFDVGVMPGMMSRLAGDPIPDAIVQPADEHELSTLAAWAQQNRIPLVPRGKATSGYGGVVPVRGGIVVEFNRMRRIIDINQEALTATVQPGVIWENLDEALGKQGLTLKSYPTSYPASTVAGWLATGGAGIGSLQAGYFRDSVRSVRMVRADGTATTLSQDDLDDVVNASGVSGFITGIELDVIPVQVMTTAAFRFTNAEDMAAFIADVYDQEMAIWSLSFTNPESGRYRNRMPARSHGSHVVHKVPETFILTLAYSASAQISSQIESAARQFHGEMLDEELAQHEWENRFNPMKTKRIAPSFIPAEVVVPVASLAQVLERLDAKIQAPLLLEGFAIRGGDIVLLGFIPHDERKLGFNVAFGLSLTVLKVALDHGGRAYGIGLYFSAFAPGVLGRETCDRLQKIRQEYDPARIMNPGKTIDKEKIASLIATAVPFEGLITTIANRFPGNPPEEDYDDQAGLPGQVAWLSYACSSCGYCVDSCDQYYGRGWESQSPRGKWRLLKMVAEGKTKLTQADIDTFLACTTCEICNERCQLEMPIEPSWMMLRGQLVQEEGFRSLPAFHIMEASARKEWNIWAHYAKDRDAWLPDDLRDKIKEQAEIAYFPGCTASFVEQDIAVATARLLDHAGIEFTYLGEEEACCGIPMLMAGRWDAWEAIMEHNVAAMKKRGATTVITSCPACRLVWNTYYRRWMEDRGEDYNIEAKHYSEILADEIIRGALEIPGAFQGRVTYHDPCHMGRASGVYEEPRLLLQSIPGLDYREMEFNREKAHCCGSVMSLVADPDAASRIGQVRINDAVEVDAQTIVTACPCCRVQLRVASQANGMDNIQIADLATLTARACGYEIPDSTPVLDQSWAIFDVMIRMMTPQGMAEMMAAMLEDMLEAMPTPMGAMMKWIRKQKPGIKTPLIAMMRPVMPKLFPILLPGMMPRVMPKMLALVKEKVPMPDFMAEQMPDLMPPAMEVLMPKMLPDIIPHFMPYMVSYLNGEDHSSAASISPVRGLNS